MRVERKPVVTTETVIKLTGDETKILKECLNSLSDLEFQWFSTDYKNFMAQLTRALNAK